MRDLAASPLVMALTLGALACHGSTPESERAALPPGMPTLQRRELAIADSTRPEDHNWPMGVSERGQIVYATSESQSPIFRVVDSTGASYMPSDGKVTGQENFAVRFTCRCAATRCGSSMPIG